MAELIRRIKEEDFQGVSNLYDGRKSIEELKWLYTDPNNSDIFNAFVAVNEKNVIIGEIAFSLSNYIQDTKEVYGVIPMNWKISREYKGMAGILLLKKVLSLGDFGITIGGSKTAQNLYPLFKFKYLSNIDEYYKILNLTQLFKSYKRKSLIKTIGMISYLIPSYYKNPSHKSLYLDIELIDYDGNNFVSERDYKNVFKKQITKKYIDWLLGCPTLKTYGFSIKKGNEYFGICVLYIQKINGINRGRIVHIPFLGNDKKLWSSVINKCITFFKKEECCIITGLVNHNLSHLGFSKSGFTKIKKHAKPLFIKDDNQNLSSININNWFLQYSEGDKAYREI